MASISLLMVSWAAAAEPEGDEPLAAGEGWGEDQAASTSATPTRATLGMCWATPDQPKAPDPAVEVSAAQDASKPADGAAAGGACMVGSRLSPGGSSSAVATSAPAEAKPEAPASVPASAPTPEAPAVAVAREDSPAASPPRASKPKSVARKVKVTPPPEAMQAWWPPATPGRLNVRFAGEASFGSAIALLFDAPFDQAASVNQHVKVLDSRKKPVPGQWVLAKGNPQMLLFKTQPGAYKLSIEEGLSAQGDLKLGAPSSGLVYVR